MKDKIKIQDMLLGIVIEAKASGKRIGFTNGCFDILHLGHIRYLREAKELCDILIIGVNSDSSVKVLKGEERPINPEGARMEVLSALECVDYITLFEEDTPQLLIEKLTPDVLIKGGDWREDQIAGAFHVKENGGEVKIIPYVEGYSTTNIIEKTKDEK
jgi:rfaE bifunctional protein nucleotidyltransferase chain/domain